MRLRRPTPNEPRLNAGFRVGDGVRHRREPSLGVGWVLKLETGSKPVLVGWDAGIETYHAPDELEHRWPRDYTRAPRAA